MYAVRHRHLPRRSHAIHRTLKHWLRDRMTGLDLLPLLSSLLSLLLDSILVL